MIRVFAKSQPRFLLAAASCALAGAAVFQFYGNAGHGYIDTSSLFYWWSYQWVNPASETQHGWLILALSGWLFFRAIKHSVASRKEIGVKGGNQTPRNSSGWNSRSDSARPALLAMMGALALHAVGFAVQQSRISILALLLFSWGVVRLAGGKEWGRAAVFPLAFLMFAIPLNVLDTLGFWLRLWVIKASSGLAHFAHIGVVQNGTQLLSPDGRYQYDVAAACSGVRSLMALTALSLLIGYLWFDSWWRRAAVLLLCFPLVYAGNVARITSIIFAAQLGGQAWGERVHEWMGLGVFAIVLGGLLAGARALERFLPEKRKDFVVGENRNLPDEKPTEGYSAKDARRAFFVAAAIVLGCGVEGIILQRLAAMPWRGSAGVALAADEINPVELPTFLGTEWIGRRAEVTAVEREILPLDTGFSRKLYVPVSDASGAVFFSVVLSGRDRTSIHRPELCLVGQGWTIRDTEIHAFELPSGKGGVLQATLLRTERVLLTKTGNVTSPDLVAYWFVSSDRAAPTQWNRLALDAWNRLFHLRADRWAYVLMQTSAKGGEAVALQRMQAVLDQVWPKLRSAPVVKP